MIAIIITIAVLVMVVIAAWLVGPYVRESLAARRRLQVMEAQLLAEQRIRATTNATLAAMRAAVRRHQVGDR